MAAGDYAGVGIEPAEEGDRFREIGRPMILERSGDQDILPMRMARTCFWPALLYARVEQKRVGQICRPINDG
jgi:hypothetical protein